MVRPPSRSSPRARPLVYKLYILHCSSLVRISTKTLPFLPLRLPLNPNGPTRARDARPRPKAKSHLSIGYRSRDRHHSPLTPMQLVPCRPQSLASSTSHTSRARSPISRLRPHPFPIGRTSPDTSVHSHFSLHAKSKSRALKTWC